MSLLFLLVIASFHSLVFSLHNVTIGSQDPATHYSGNWSMTNTSAGYGLMISRDRSAFATFTFTGLFSSTLKLKVPLTAHPFTGVAVYYVAPLWPYKVTTEVCLDSHAGIPIDLQDHSGTVGLTVPAAPRWGMTGLKNTSHPLIVYTEANGSYIVVDSFMYAFIFQTLSYLN